MSLLTSPQTATVGWKIPIKSSSLAQRETLPGEVKLQNLQPQLLYMHLLDFACVF